MADAGNDAQWTSIADFSPGIHSNISPNHPDGTANPDGTFSCIALHDGSLGPLPRVNQVIFPPITGGPYPVTGIGGHPDASANLNEENRIIGLHAIGPVFFDSKNTAGFGQNNTEIFIATERWISDPSVNDTDQFRIYRYRRNYANPEWDGIKEYDHTIEPFNPFKSPPWADFATTRSNNTDRTKAGPVITAWAMYGNSGFFPDDTNPTVNGVVALPGNNGDPNLAGTLGNVNLVGHQGRLVLFPLLILGKGDSTLWVTNESLFWTEVNNARTQSAFTSPNLFTVAAGFENPGGYHVMASLSFDELLLIKSTGGAVVVRGDLDNFTAINYPYVRSAGFTDNQGTKSVFGMMYPVDGSGVWLWSGGPESTFLTPHLEDDFWRPPVVASSAGSGAGVTQGFLHYPSQSAAWGDWVMWPNNWLYDTTAANQPNQPGGWWRILNPDEFCVHRWATDWRGVCCYGTPSGFSTKSDPCIYEFDRTQAAANQWKFLSHPISNTIDREVTLMGCSVVASSETSGSIDVRWFSDQDPVGQMRTFQIDGTQAAPTFRRESFNVTGTGIGFELTCQSDEQYHAAPVLHELRYGLIPGFKTPGT